jgi:peptidoglycan hydrolase FlgJ
MHPINSVGNDPVLPAHSGKNGELQANERNAALRQAAMDLEASFLTEMLKSAGFGKARESNGGGAGEDQFSSLLVRAQAEQMTLAGGIGLAESLFKALMEAENGTTRRTGSD